MNILDSIQSELTSLKEQNAIILAKLENLSKATPTDSYMTKDEVCAYFGGIHVTTLDGWVKAGKLQMYGLSGSRFFKRSEIESAPIKINNLKKVA